MLAHSAAGGDSGGQSMMGTWAPAAAALAAGAIGGVAVYHWWTTRSQHGVGSGAAAEDAGATVAPTAATAVAAVAGATALGLARGRALAIDTPAHAVTSPLVVAATWDFACMPASGAAACLLANPTGETAALDAVAAGINLVERDLSRQYFVGHGGLPNAAGVCELDSAIMDGVGSRLGAVMALQRCRTPVCAARAALDHPTFNVFVGEGAGLLAVAAGMREESVLTPQARAAWHKFRADKDAKEDAAHGGGGGVAGDSSGGSCDGGGRGGGGSDGGGAHRSHDARVGDGADGADGVAFGAAVRPSPHPTTAAWAESNKHDTVGCIAVDAHGRIAAATSTSGWAFCAPGRVGDSPLVGSGLYAAHGVGAAVATGDGEEIMRCCMSFLAVEYMRGGMSPQQACDASVARLREVLRSVEAGSSGCGGAASGGGGPALWEPGSPLCVAVMAVSTRFHAASAGGGDGDDTEGVTVAVDTGASSTIGPLHPHGDQGPHFPYAVWRSDDVRGSGGSDADSGGGGADSGGGASVAGVAASALTGDEGVSRRLWRQCRIHYAVDPLQR